MHTAQLLDEALNLARQLGFSVRHDYFGGNGGGACQLCGRKVLFVDLALWPDEQLQHVLDVLSQEQELQSFTVSDQLRQMLQSHQDNKMEQLGSLCSKQAMGKTHRLGKPQ
mgnify:CR=1 FL=1